MEIALKVDVDTHRGMELGVPNLASVLKQEGIAASFFVTMGPDNSGRAIVRLAKNRGFLRKILRSRAVSAYGLRTMLSGTVLPARPIALSFPSIMRRLKDDGFEVGVHGYDHVRWQDRIDALSEAQIRNEIADAFEAYRAIFREPPRSFAAPGWRTSAVALRILDEMGLRYRSDTRGRRPFRCAVDGMVLTTPEIPTTLPTLDEVLGRRGLRDSASLVRFYSDNFVEDALNVHTIHAEIEGIGHLEMFGSLLRELKKKGARFVTLGEVAERLRAAELPVCEVVRGTIEGRAGWISAQGSTKEPITPDGLVPGGDTTPASKP